MPYVDKPAFRCRGCGHLTGPEAAGVRPTPAACPVCGKGAIHKPGGFDLDPDNWEVLAEATPERLEELGLAADAVCGHTPCHDRDAAGNLQRCREALAALEAKERDWKANKDAIVDEVHRLDDEHDELASKGVAGDDPKELEAHFGALQQLRQKADDLVNSEYTDRDAAHKAELGAAVAREGRPVARTGGPRHVVVGVRDRSRTFDRAG